MKKHILIGISLLLAINGFSQNKKICISVDDLPLTSTDNSIKNQKYVINQLITYGKEMNAPLIGFVNESKIFRDAAHTKLKISLLEKWLINGFELGNHGYAHLNYDITDTSTYFKDILKGEKISKALSKKHGIPYQYFRHPFLHAGNTVEKENALESFLQRNDYLEAPVTVDNSEWIYARAYDLAIDKNDDINKEKIAASYLDYMMDKLIYFESNAKQLFDKSISQILLIHANRINADLLGKLLLRLKNYGYEFISMSEALEDPVYKSNDHIAKPWGISWLHRWAKNKKVTREFYKGEPSCPEFIQSYSGLSE